MAADWLSDAVLYEIYPQSFADSNGDGIGDLRGVIDRLDHLTWLGVDTIWFNPCFASPFRDAGYDVADYLTVAPRYGTNDDLVELVARARERGIRVLLDLVVGHTSDQHPWFQRELHAAGPDPDGDRYVWADRPPLRDTSDDTPGIASWVPSPGPRPGYYLRNYYDSQPALNYGWGRPVPAEPWRDPVDGPGPVRNRRALQEILGFWLGHGVAGFRVDMAFSLVKDDPGQAGTVALWRQLREWLELHHPDAVLIPEGVEPRVAGSRAFDADFFLVIQEPHASLFDNHGAGTLPWHPPVEPFFDAYGRGSTATFLAAWQAAKAGDPARPVLMSTADHDFDRLRLRDAHPRAARHRADLPAHLGQRAVPVLRRRDRDALPARDAGRRGRDLPSAVQPGRVPDADAVGRRPERGVLDRGRRPALPAGRPVPGPPHRRRSAGRPRLHAAPGPQARGAAEGDARARRPGRQHRAARRLPPRLPAWRHPPRRVNPARAAGSVVVPGAGGATALLAHGIRIGDDDEVRADGFGYGVFELAGR
jgi:alpha-glucosidase